MGILGPAHGLARPYCRRVQLYSTTANLLFRTHLSWDPIGNCELGCCEVCP